MRRVLAVFVMAAALGLVTLLPGPASAQVDLGAAALTEQEVGPGFARFQAGPVAEATALSIASYLATFVRAPSLLNFSFEAVAVALVDDSTAQAVGQDGLAAAIAAQIGTLEGFGVSATPVPAPAIGRETLRYTLSGNFNGIAIAGDTIIWRQGALIAGVAALGNRNPSAEGYARAQEQKLLAFGVTD